MKTVKAVPPYVHPGFLNFKSSAFEAWSSACNDGNMESDSHVGVVSSHYPWRLFHSFFYRYELPSLKHCSSEARLCLVEPVSIRFDAFPSYSRYEVIPFVWDCWPCHFESMCSWLTKHHVRTAIFTSSQTANLISSRFPGMNVMHCPEGIDTALYYEGKPLKERTIDLLEFGRGLKGGDVLNKVTVKGHQLNHVCTVVNGKFQYDNVQLYAAMADAKATIALPRSITQPEVAGDIETLTQRYWENMLSRMVMVGHAPAELIDLIGYNPVVEVNYEQGMSASDFASSVAAKVSEVLENLDSYQPLVDKNRTVALELGDWKLRMKNVQNYLREYGYYVPSIHEK